MPVYLPDRLRNNQLFFVGKDADCISRETGLIDLSKGLPKRIFIPCKNDKGEMATFSSTD
jgi:hypothetical protein